MNVDDLFPSTYLKAADLRGHPRIVTIEGCAREQIGDADTKPVLRFVETNRGLVLNRTNADSIAAIYGKKIDRWRGHRIELFPTKVPFQGRKVDAIRVRVPSSGPGQPADPIPQPPPPPPTPPAQPSPPDPQLPLPLEEPPAPSPPMDWTDDNDLNW